MASQLQEQQKQQWYHQRGKWIRRFLLGLVLVLLASQQWSTVDVRVMSPPEFTQVTDTETDGSEQETGFQSAQEESMEVHSSNGSQHGSKEERAKPNDPLAPNLRPIVNLEDLFTSQELPSNRTNDTCNGQQSTLRFINCQIDTPAYFPSSLAMCENLKTVESLTLVALPIPTAAPKLQTRVHWHEQYKDIFWERARAKRDSILKSVRESEKVWDPEFFLDTFRSVDSPSTMAVIRDVYAELDQGRVQTRCGKELIQFNQCVGKEYDNHDDPPVADHFDQIFFVPTLWSLNFFHSMVEQLPRLIRIKDLIQATDFPIVIRKPGSDFFITVASQILDIPRSRFVPKTINTVIHANVLYIPEPTACTRLQPAEAVVAHRTILEKIPKDSLTPRTILLIRRRSYRRVLANHDKLEAALRKALPQEMFEVLDDDNLPPPGIPQFQMFARAKIIVGPHGAGFYGLLAAQPESAAVVELLPDSHHFDICYFRLSTVLGLEYHPLAMFPITEKRNRYVVDVMSVVKIVKEIAERQGK